MINSCRKDCGLYNEEARIKCFNADWICPVSDLNIIGSRSQVCKDACNLPVNSVYSIVIRSVTS